MSSSQFHTKLAKYINTGCIDRTDLFLSLAKPNLPFYKNAGEIIKMWGNSDDRIIGKSLNFTCNKYTGENKKVKEMMQYINQELSDELFGAYVHGSLATNDSISYSDFDGLIILKNEVMRDRKKLINTAIKLSKAYSIMISMDALQHHGWFVLTEKDCKNWPVTYFPPVLFDYSKSLLNSGKNIEITYLTSDTNNKNSLNRLCNSIIRHLSKHSIPENSFQLKSILSEYMLMPSLYLQYKNGTGIYKKYSFEEASKDFKSEDWRIMNEVSEIRSKWKLNSGLTLTDYPKIITPWVKKSQIKHSSKVPDELMQKLDSEFIARMIKLTNLIRNKIL